MRSCAEKLEATLSNELNVIRCTLPVAGEVCFSISGGYYVTAQPIYVWPGTSPYQIIGQTGIKTVLSVRDPLEVTLPLTPFDLTEVSQLVASSVGSVNVPLPHIAMTQAQFNQQAARAAAVIKEWPKPILIHCSTGDRASAAFAAFLMTCGGYGNAAAVDFATTQLALQNAQFIAWLQAYAPA
jgi:protein tyrosine phosphatase (PTP) superfamily phosphohydrolase (DUF442 family)